MKFNQTCDGSAARLRTLFLLVVVALLTALPLPVQATDEVPAAFRDKLYDVHFVTPTEALVVGYPGLILRSTDAGATWTRRKLETLEPFFSVDFSDKDNGWIVGRSGLIFATTDGGKNWTKQESGVTEALFDVDFWDAKHGVAVGNFGTILKTNDGGATWNAKVFELMSSAAINGVRLTGPESGYIVGEYPIWETELTEDVTVDQISNLFKTSDDGVTWERIDTTTPKALYQVLFLDELNGYAVGAKGTLIRTVDGGATWTNIATPFENILVNMIKFKGGILVAGTEGVLLHVQGTKVMPMKTHTYTWLNDVEFGDENHGIAVGGRGTVLYTTDGGTSWTKHPIK
jgi:photosystem II stability/assembly factor-like uncharacterized protein